jgi:hypothetical protein
MKLLDEDESESESVKEKNKLNVLLNEILKK